MPTAARTPVKRSPLEVPAEDWPPRKIKKLRKRLDMNQGEFGAELFDYTESVAQPKVSHLEAGDYKPSAAVRRTLRRLEARAEQNESK